MSEGKWKLLTVYKNVASKVSLLWKDTLAKQQAGSVLSMADPDALSQNLALAKTSITKLLVGDTPRAGGWLIVVLPLLSYSC